MIEEYRLDEAQLATLHALYDLPLNLKPHRIRPMQKPSVKTVSIIETLSGLAHELVTTTTTTTTTATTTPAAVVDQSTSGSHLATRRNRSKSRRSESHQLQQLQQQSPPPPPPPPLEKRRGVSMGSKPTDVDLLAGGTGKRGRHGLEDMHHHRSYRGRGRTPDWIRKIFDVAKRGNLDKLVSIVRVSCFVFLLVPEDLF